ncbi:MAG TPA: NFACT RNA binding domain-containing protein [Herpetosiphonaceae bacterium]
MNYDALTVKAVADELRSTIVGGRIQRVVLPTPLSIGLEVYHAGQRYQLLASANPTSARAHLLSARPTRGIERETPLLLLLRKYVRNGFIAAVEQPDLERILVLSIIKHPSPRKDERDEDAIGDEDDDVDDEQRCELILEIMGQRSNIILVDDDNLILDAVKRIPSEGTRRTIMPREVYIAPPRPHRRDPRTITAAGVAALLDGTETDLGKALTAAYGGVSPQQAREAIMRATGQPGVALDPTLPFAAIADALRALWTESFQPSLAYQGARPIAFAPYRMTQFEDVRAVASISAALDTFYAEAEQITAHAQRRDALVQRLLDVRERQQRQRDALGRELERANALERLRWEGEMIFGYLHTVEPGQTELRVEGRAIKLDPGKTPVENAQARFREYDKAKGALAGVPERLGATDAQLAYLDETLTLLKLADSYEAIAGIEREVYEQGVLKPPSGKAQARGPRSRPLRLRSSDGLTIYVGRSAGQNEEVTFRLARPDDRWFHVREIPGAHVIVQAEDEPPARTIEEAAGLAAYFSAARESTSVEVVMTQRRHVRKVAGGPPGLVSYRNEQTVRAAPLAPAALQAAQNEPPDQI